MPARDSCVLALNHVLQCGRFPLYIETMRRCVKYWIRVLKLPEHRLVKNAIT